MENAFKYGIEQTIGIESIRVFVTRERGKLSIKIHNTGSALHEGWREGMGITNCRERLRVLYRSAASVNIANDAETGVVASVSLPLSATIE